MQIELILLLPLIGAVITGLCSRFIPDKAAHFITCILMIIVTLLSWKIFFDVKAGEIYHEKIFTWIKSGSFEVSWGFYVDSLTAVMLIVVTSVSTLVHIYAIGYMHHDEHQPRFFAYLSLFTFFMLVLVTGDNLLQTFVGWEGVGLCSYLLIGFWFHKKSANAAAIKAFVVNRVGDFAFVLGIFATFWVFGSLNYADIFSKIASHQETILNFAGLEFNAITFIAALLFVGCMGKSAQIGLHVWLPDAMEGPTPVSALIHAATMVTAGVFLVARCSYIFEYAPIVKNFITIIGAITCLFAATIAITQNDIKKIIAYSTCSQLGYMFFACGVSAYSAGIFHLMTHAAFKALLFLGAGAVIHAMSDEQDIRKMGGIWRKIPITYTMFWIGSLALAGIFPLAGYYSKDIILEAAYVSPEYGQFAFILGLVAAFLTAFYSWRLIILTFHGKPRASEEVMHHVHESPYVMLVPLFILAIGAVVMGYVGANLWGMVDHEAKFWGAALFSLNHNEILEKAHHLPMTVKLIPLFVGVAGIILAYIIYIFVKPISLILASGLKPLYNLSYNKYYIDEIYEIIFVKPTKELGNFLWKFADAVVIDGLGPNGAAFIARKSSQIVARLQSGLVYHYAFVMIIGLVGLISWYVSFFS